MSDKDIEQEPAEAADVAADEPPKSRPGNALAGLAILIAVVAMAGTAYMAWQDWRGARDAITTETLATLQGRVAAATRSLADLEASVATLDSRAPAVAAEIDGLRRDLDARLRLLDSLPARMATLESSIASLAGVSEGARDAWILAESEYYIQIANAQLQLAGNPHLAALALRMADERLVQLADPGLTRVRGAIADELAALDAMKKPDIEGVTLTLASLARVVESLPLASTAETGGEEPAANTEQRGAGRAWASFKHAMSGLVRVTPPERAKLLRLPPDAEFFLRNNIVLQLQSARLALLRGEPAIFQQTLDDTSSLLSDYFDLGSAQVTSALATIAEIRSHEFTTEMPDISASLQLLRQFRTLNENQQ